MTKPLDKLRRLLNSALAADAMMPHDFRRVRVRRRAAVFVSTSGKTKEQIVADMADALRKAGMLKE